MCWFITTAWINEFQNSLINEFQNSLIYCWTYNFILTLSVTTSQSVTLIWTVDIQCIVMFSVLLGGEMTEGWFPLIHLLLVYTHKCPSSVLAWPRLDTVQTFFQSGTKITKCLVPQMIMTSANPELWFTTTLYQPLPYLVTPSVWNTSWCSDGCKFVTQLK